MIFSCKINMNIQSSTFIDDAIVIKTLILPHEKLNNQQIYFLKSLHSK